VKRIGFLSLEGIVALYFLSYVPNILLTKLATSAVHPALGRPLTGLEILPASLLMNLVLTYAFILLSGWHRDAHAVNALGLRVPVPTRYTLLSGVGTALVLFTVPLSFTFTNVSIPFIQLLMRGDILLIAPVVDLLFGRRVRWWSWTALVIVGIAVLLVVRQRGGFQLPSLAIATIVLYTIGYFTRLAVMTRIAKRGDPAMVRQYFVEEKVIALPMSVVALAGLSLAGFGTQSGELAWGFLAVWTDPVIWPVVGIAVTLTIVSVFAAMILLAPQENTYCVPLERSSSLLAGLVAAYLLYWAWGLAPPTTAELIGALLLIGAILLLTLAPRYESRRQAARLVAAART
jgi:drug/metabolite transporter (DMT)-like permease